MIKAITDNLLNQSQCVHLRKMIVNEGEEEEEEVEEEGEEEKTSRIRRRCHLPSAKCVPACVRTF